MQRWSASLWLSLQKSASRMPDLEVTTKDDISWKRRFWKNSGRLVEGISMMTNLLRSFNQPIQTKKNDIIYTYLHVWAISKGHCRYKVYLLNIVDQLACNLSLLGKPSVITAKFCTATGDKKREDGWPILSPHSFYILVVKFTIIPVFAVQN